MCKGHMYEDYDKPQRRKLFIHIQYNTIHRLKNDTSDLEIRPQKLRDTNNENKVILL